MMLYFGPYGLNVVMFVKQILCTNEECKELFDTVPNLFSDCWVIAKNNKIKTCQITVIIYYSNRSLTEEKNIEGIFVFGNMLQEKMIPYGLSKK